MESTIPNLSFKQERRTAKTLCSFLLMLCTNAKKKKKHLPAPLSCQEHALLLHPLQQNSKPARGK
jgi:hypothetical protein